jgi:hypothetical protein
LKNEIVLEVGVEGGSIKLLGTRLSQGWRFRVSTVDQTAMFLSEEDRGNLPLESRRASDWVDSWEAALDLLDQYPWHSFHPMVVHPEFQQKVWEAVQRRCERDQAKGQYAPSDWNLALERWREQCGVSPSP